MTDLLQWAVQIDRSSLRGILALLRYSTRPDSRQDLVFIIGDLLPDWMREAVVSAVSDDTAASVRARLACFCRAAVLWDRAHGAP